MNKFLEKEIQENGINSIKRAIEEGVNPKLVKNAEEIYKNYTKDYRDFRINLTKISTNIELIRLVIGTEAIYDRKEELIELGNLLIVEANKIREVGKGVSK